MELREFFKIFKIHGKLFWSVIILFIVSALVFYFVQAQSYKTSITLNITRIGKDQAQEYKYDDFYRLQADDKFADTLAQWTQSPYILDQIFEGNGMGYKGFFDANKMSSQIVEVTFVSSDQKEALQIARRLQDVLKSETKKLNEIQNQNNWFMILDNKPIIADNRYTLLFLLLLGAAIGFFVSFWLVLIKHYLTDDK